MTATALVAAIMTLIFGLIIVRDARKDASSVGLYADDAMAQLEKARLLRLDSRDRLRNARRTVAALEQERKKQAQAEQVTSDSSVFASLKIRRRFSKIFWRRLTGENWEGFLADLFKAHGYSVELTKVSGDQGVDLIVHYSRVRLAIQAKGYSGSVVNAAVQEAVAGRIFYNCSHCAVITNSTFTKSARELTSRTSCILIGESEIDDLITDGLKRYF
ncbi:MAG: restriction endonuclease [Pirellula sp.]